MSFDYEITFINVGHGDASLIVDLGTSQQVLIDIANFTSVNAFINYQNLQAIFITHWDADHIAGLPGLLARLLQNNISGIPLYLNKQSARTATSRRLRAALRDAVNDGAINLKPACSDIDMPISLLNGSFDVLWPPYANGLYSSSTNQDSIVIKFQCNQLTILIGGDAPANVWQNIDSHLLQAHIFKFPHHGSIHSNCNGNMTCNELITAVNPQFVVVSARRNDLHHPSADFLSAAAQNNRRNFLYTYNGDVLLKADSISGNISHV